MQFICIFSNVIMHKTFEWNTAKNLKNIQKHGIDFIDAQNVFFDKKKVYAIDKRHSKIEKRYFCFGKVRGGVMTVRFTYRGKNIRIIGAGYWRKGKKAYEEKNKIH